MAISKALNKHVLKQESYDQCPIASTKPHHSLIADTGAWQSLMQKTPGTLAFKDWQPNFSQEKVLIYSMGTKRSGGHAVKLIEAQLDQKSLLVKVEQTSPAPGSINTAQLTSPCVIALLHTEGAAEVKVVDAKTGEKL